MISELSFLILVASILFFDTDFLANIRGRKISREEGLFEENMWNFFSLVFAF